jgi:hypothetical protein
MFALAIALAIAGGGCAGRDTGGGGDPNAGGGSVGPGAGPIAGNPSADPDQGAAEVPAASEILAIGFRSQIGETLPAAIALDAWHNVPGLETADLQGCAPGSDGLTNCTLTLASGREAHVSFVTTDSPSSAEFECESRAGVAAGATLAMQPGFAQWTSAAGDRVLIAANQVCFSTQILSNGQVDTGETVRVATALGAQVGAIQPTIALNFQPALSAGQ